MLGTLHLLYLLFSDLPQINILIVYYFKCCICKWEGRCRNAEDSGWTLHDNFNFFVFDFQSHLMLPTDKVISEITTNFDQMMKTACAISKLEYLLEAARLTYDNVRDSRQPKKPMTDMGADGKRERNDWSMYHLY